MKLKVFLNFIVLIFSTTLLAQESVSKDAQNINPEVTAESNSAITTETAQNTEKSFNDKWGHFGFFAQGGLPHFANYGLDWFTPQKNFSFSFGYGSNYLSTGVVELNFSNYDVRGRWHVFGGSTFVGVGYGQQSFIAKVSGTYASTPTVIQYDLTSTYVLPHLGWITSWDWGLSLGFDMGYLMPLTTSSSLTINPNNSIVANDPTYQQQEQDTKDAANNIGKAGIPYIGLLRIGFIF